MSHNITIDDEIYQLLHTSAAQAQCTVVQLIQMLIVQHATTPHTVRCTEQDIYEWASLARPPAPAIPPELLRREVNGLCIVVY